MKGIHRLLSPAELQVKLIGLSGPPPRALCDHKGKEKQSDSSVALLL
jgi:hypothetical protein